MKVLLLTPGTGNFHCGSCLRDEALLRGLRRLGHDTTINALYLPLVLDHTEGIDGDDVSMGGINMYLHVKSALFRFTPGFVGRWLDRPALLRKAAGRADMTSPQELGLMTEQMLLGTHGKTRHEVDQLLAHLREHDTPDVVLLNNALLLGLAEPIRQALGCAVACTLQGEDTFVDRLPEPWCAGARGLMARCVEHVDLFLPVSAYHGALMADRMSIPERKLRVVYNGIEAERYPAQASPPDPPVIGYLARLCEDKGLRTLADAFILLHERGLLGEAALRIVGAATAADAIVEREVMEKMYRAGLEGRVAIQTNVSFEDKIAALRGMSVLSVPATYGESFGMYVLEANVCGVPVVEPDHAGLAEVVAQTGGGIVYDPGEDHAAALAEALAVMLADAPRRAALGRAGRAAVLDRFDADTMARNVASALETICPAPSA